MTEIVVPLESLEYPPRTMLGTLRTLKDPYSQGNAIKMFCETVKGERPLVPSWGLPDFVHSPQVQSEEVEAIILSNLRQFFEGNFTISCRDIGLGHKECKIEYTYDDSKGEIIIQL